RSRSRSAPRPRGRSSSSSGPKAACRSASATSLSRTGARPCRSARACCAPRRRRSPRWQRSTRCGEISVAKAPAPKNEAFVKWFRSATPYIHQWGGATFVIAFGGEVLADGEFQQLTHDINVLVSLEVRVVLVHGTRPQIEEQMRQHGVESRYVDGR